MGIRIIIFRGKRLDNGKWVEGFFVKRIDRLTLIPKCYILVQEEDTSGITGEPTGYLNTEFSWHEVIPETVGQFTGLTDKNGKKIFEGDIVHCKSRWDNANMVVIFEYGQFRMVLSENYRSYQTNIGFYDINCFDKEVIGNVTDNPELLKGE